MAVATRASAIVPITRPVADAAAAAAAAPRTPAGGLSASKAWMIGASGGSAQPREGHESRGRGRRLQRGSRARNVAVTEPPFEARGEGAEVVAKRAVVARARP